MKTNTSAGIDHITAKMIKCVTHQISEPLTVCINRCLVQGVFPINFKTAKVTPIYKSRTRSYPNNYRSISALSVTSKIFEKKLSNRFEDYFKSINFFYDKQYGFRPESNTLSATVYLVTQLKNSIDEK